MIVTPQQLWQDFDRKAIPLAVSIVSKFQHPDFSVKYVYFNGEMTAHGCARIYAKLYAPNEGSQNVVLVMDDLENGVESFDAAALLKRGFAVLVVDYAGENPSSSRYTIYPKDLKNGNYFLNKDCIKEISSEPKQSCRYIWTVTALRAVTYLEQEGFNKIAMLGISHGSHQAFKAAFFKDCLCGAATLFSGTYIVPPNEEAPDNALIAFRAALKDSSYSPKFKAPVFIQTTSNEQNSNLDEMNEIYLTSGESPILFSISERSDRTVNHEQSQNIELFFDAVFKDIPLIKEPNLVAKSSGGILYYSLTADTSEEITDVKLFISRSTSKPAYRNWQKQSIEKTVPGEYLAKASVYSTKEPIYAFANITYSNGFCISTQVLETVPSTLGITPAPFTQKRRIYDSDMDTGEWVMLGKSLNSESLSLQEGPFDISGVHSPTNHIATYSLADVQYKANSDSVLQLILYSDIEQKLKFSFTMSNNSAKYSVTKNVSPSDNWIKFTLSSNDFRSAEGAMESWDKIVTFEILGNGKFLINSMLWI